MNSEKEDLYIFGVILSRYENPSYHEKKFINKYKKLIIKKPVETTNEQLTETEKVYILNCLDYCDKQDDLSDEIYTSIKKKFIV